MSQKNAVGIFPVNRINNEVVHEVPIPDKDMRPILGEALFDELFANVFLCARKKSGKTSAIYKILQKCANKHTKIMVFCSTINKDPSWDTIKTWAMSKDIPLIGYTSIEDDDGSNLLKDLIKDLQDDDQENPQEAPMGLLLLDEPEKKERKRKPKMQSPEWIFILDDLADELKKPIIATFLKKNRHFKAKTIVSSQYMNDLYPAARKQLDYVILFKGHQQKKIDEICRDVDVGITKDELWQLYQFATEKPFSFLYIDVRGGTFRRNFNELIEVS
jgi:hypothetical protein